MHCPHLMKLVLPRFIVNQGLQKSTKVRGLGPSKVNKGLVRGLGPTKVRGLGPSKVNKGLVRGLGPTKVRGLGPSKVNKGQRARTFKSQQRSEG